MSRIEKKSDKFYYPFCRQNNCGGVLKIKINDNFSIDYECEKNMEHKGKNIYFKTFERFYLKEDCLDKCSICNSLLETLNKFRCKNCNNYYCILCFKYDSHIKENINNFEISSKICPAHKSQFTSYCIDCKEYLCNGCLKGSIDKHNNHKKVLLLDLMPSDKQIEQLKINIKSYDNLIESLETWINELIEKVKALQRRIINEKEIMIKLTSNYNYLFINYTYFKNFEYLQKYISFPICQKF